jgi:hypothetical protein
MPEGGIWSVEDNRDWKYATDVHAYVKHIGTWTAEVGEDRGGNWSALVISGTRTHFGGYYPSMAEAKAWCERQIAEFIAAEAT